jgi:hypothetical protein
MFKKSIEGDDWGVVPSQGSSWVTQKQGLNPPTHPKGGVVRWGIAKKQSEALGTTWDKVERHAGQTEK